jgi:TATA-box binding protein (TBP) (component of TFIID and TFIIIB)
MTTPKCPKYDEYLTDDFIAGTQVLSHDMLQMCEKMYALGEVYKSKKSTDMEKMQPNQIKLSTMTMFSKLIVPSNFNLSHVIEVFLKEGLEKIREYIGLEVHISFPVRKTQTIRGKSINNFYNQLTMWYKDGTKKSIKLFINGNVHVTGCRSLKEYVCLVRRVCMFLNNIFANGEPVCRASSIDIQMINTNFGINIGLDLSKLKKVLLGYGRCATYDREVYPGLNLKVPTSYGREASVLVFISGNIIITGAKHFLEIYEAYKFILDSIYANSKDLIKVRLESNGNEKKKKCQTAFSHGYDEHILNSIIPW